MMEDFLQALTEQLQAMSWLEAVAVGLAVAYLLLVIRQNIWCWACAFASTAIYVYLFHSVALLMESALNVFYLLMAVYGWWQWRQGGAGHTSLPVTQWSWRVHIVAITGIVALSFSSAVFLERYFEPAYPLLDSLTTWSAVWATFLVTRKELTNWWYWLAIDAVSIYLYLNRGLPLTALLFVFYLILIPIGYRSWRADYQHADTRDGAPEYS